MNTFQDLNLPVPLQEALVRMNYANPTEIQAKAIPLALQGHDILGSAQTGTGKTAAFGIPLVNKLIEDPTACALILTPTRELAEQVIDVLHQLLNKRRDIKTALLIGGMPIQKQFLRLKERPRVIVGTPGRINDHLDRRSLHFKETRILVLDEADRMLDMGFGIQLEAIAKHLPEQRQTFMFSATIPKRILSLADKFLNNPQRVKVGHTHAPLAKIKQDVVRTSEDKKYDTLLKELDLRTGSVIIFAKTKRRVDLLAKKLQEKMGAGAMHGDLRQHQRTRILKEFRDQKYRVLVATDVAARGLDIPHIAHVINYDLPQAPEDYIHRIGRTARGFAEGSALCFISREDEKYWRAIERLLGGDESGPCMQRGPSAGAAPRSRQRPGFGARSNDSRSSSKPRFGERSGSRFGDEKPRFGARSADDRPRGQRSAGSNSSRFADDRSRAPARSADGNGPRFSDERSRSARPAGSNNSRFADDRSRSSGRPSGSNGSRFADDRNRAPARSSEGNGSRFGDDRNRAPARSSEGNGSRFADDRNRAPARSSEGNGSRFAGDRNRAPARSADNNGSRFSDERSRNPARAGGNGSRFASDRPRSPAHADGGNGSRFGNDKPRSAGRFADKPAARKTFVAKKSYGPQNRPASLKKLPEEKLLD